MARLRKWRVRDRGAYEEKGIRDTYKVGAKITMSREPAHGGEARETRYT